MAVPAPADDKRTASANASPMRKVIAATIALLVSGGPIAAGAADAPYLKLAQALGTPDLASSIGPEDKSDLEVKFAKAGETATAWTKLTTVSIVKVPAEDTGEATLGVISTFHDTLVARHVHVDRFDTSSAKPYTCYFEFHLGTERDKGIAYSPQPGYVTIAQVAEKLDTTITSDDVKVLKSIIGR
jgi:hypothetical protein